MWIFLVYRGVAPEERKARAMKTHDRAGLSTRAEHILTALLGGQYKRVMIARAPLDGPRLPFAVESTESLDSATANEVMAMLGNLNTRFGTLVGIVTHDPSIESRCGRRIELLGDTNAADRRAAA